MREELEYTEPRRTAVVDWSVTILLSALWLTEFFLLLRLALRFFAISPYLLQKPWAYLYMVSSEAVYRISFPLVAPYAGSLGDITYSQPTFEWQTVIAMIGYGIVFMGLVIFLNFVYPEQKNLTKKGA